MSADEEHIDLRDLLDDEVRAADVNGEGTPEATSAAEATSIVDGSSPAVEGISSAAEPSDEEITQLLDAVTDVNNNPAGMDVLTSPSEPTTAVFPQVAGDEAALGDFAALHESPVEVANRPRRW
ncbi:MAG: hypothetical protein LBJ07_00410, partial [Actinomycetes bacterium]|nr:hypothetical protein [Actinomycetes bacterium]